MRGKVITHLFLGDDCAFWSRKFIRAIVETSSLVHRFVVFAAEDTFEEWTSFFDKMDVDKKSYLLTRSGGRGQVAALVDLFRIGLFSSSKVLSHRRHYNLILLVMLFAMGKRMSFMCWGDVPAREHGFARILQIFRFALYKVGLVQISSEIPVFRKNCFSRLRMVTIPYLRDNGYVLKALGSSVNKGDRVLLIGNNAWYFDCYQTILDGINWLEWDRVICMLNYGNLQQKDEIDAFCDRNQRRYGAKLVLWREMVPFEDYISVLRQCQVYVFPAQTQGGIDLAYNMMLLGKVVVCRGVVYKWLKSLGCIVFDLDKVQLERLGENSPLSVDDATNNRMIICRYTDKSAENIQRWDDVFLKEL